MPPQSKLLAVVAGAGRFFKEWPARWQAADGSKKKRAILLTGLLAGGLLLLAGGYRAIAPNATAIIINGQRVAVIDSHIDVSQIIVEILQEEGRGGYQGLQVTDTIDYQKIRVRPQELTGREQLKTLLKDNLNLVAAATVINIDGQPQIVVRDDDTATAVLERFKQSFLPAAEAATVLEVKFDRQVTFTHRQVQPEEIMSPEAALEKLKGTAAASQEYIVKEGDSLWSIAREHDLLVEDIRAANPDLKGERLDIGQHLRLTTVQPLLQVMVVYNQEVKEPVAYETKVTTNTSMLRGQERVIQAGSEGERQVIYQVTTRNGVQVDKKELQSQILKEPVTRIVERGSRVLLASRGGGSGRLAWPIRGAITSPYGYRGKEFHSGMDIDGDIGDAVGAAASGRVIFVGYSGGYGRMVTIDHGDGLVTRYAHLSGYNVKTGQQVERGEVIGFVGVSGRTTGSHLHFEVLVNGSYRNPRDYLS